MQMTNGDRTRFPIIMAQVWYVEGSPGEDLGSVGKIQPPVPERRLTLAWIERDLHYLCTHNK
jgi:hypothetical protein